MSEIVRPGRPPRLASPDGAVVLTASAFLAAAVLAPAGQVGPGPVLAFLVVFGYLGHVGGTAWLGTVPEVRDHVRGQPVRYLVVPSVALAGAVAASAALPAGAFDWCLLGFYAWQLHHSHTHNLGILNLVAAWHQADRVSPFERRILHMAAGCGVTGLLAHPTLAGLAPDPDLAPLFPVAGLVLAGTGLLGLLALARRKRADQSPGFVAASLTSLLFFVPFFTFPSPLAAFLGMALAHGLQYLWLLRIVALTPRDAGPTRVSVQPAALRLGLLAAVIVSGGLVLHVLSRFHHASGLWPRALYGIALGIIAAHFVVDAGLWRGHGPLRARMLPADQVPTGAWRRRRIHTTRPARPSPASTSAGRA